MGVDDKLMPFFTYYGGKWRVAPKYPAPRHQRVIEPFAGSAGYALRYAHHDVWINDVDPVVIGTWSYLAHVSQHEVLALPDIEVGQTVDDLAVPQEARWLIGWWLNKGSAQPKRQPSTFMLRHAAGAPYWGASIRARIAAQLPAIRHWTITCQPYDELPEVTATWFIDPPYVRAGHHYRYGSSRMDYTELAHWCRERPGQVIACEADDADWLPFAPLAVIDGTEGRQKQARARTETVWCSG